MFIVKYLFFVNVFIYFSDKGVERSAALTNLSAQDVLSALKQLVK